MRASGMLPTMMVAAGALIAGCASGPPRATTANLTRAQTLVAQAESNGAQQYAPADLQAARDKAQQADRLASRDSQSADRLANEAAADAQLASARTQNAKAQHALDDVNRSLRSLREESERNTNGTAAPAPSGAASAAPQPPAPAPAGASAPPAGAPSTPPAPSPQD